jgi:hypothetical protein
MTWVRLPMSIINCVVKPKTCYDEGAGFEQQFFVNSP